MHGTSNTLATVDSNAPGDSELNAGFEGVVGLRPRPSQSDIGRNFHWGFVSLVAGVEGSYSFFWVGRWTFGDILTSRISGEVSPKDMEVMSFRTF